MVLLFSPSIYRFPGCLYCISKNLRTARRLLGEYIPIGDEPKRKPFEMQLSLLAMIPLGAYSRCASSAARPIRGTSRSASCGLAAPDRWRIRTAALPRLSAALVGTDFHLG